MRVRLVLISDQGERTVYRLKKLPTVIGRGRDADLTLAHPLASRHHCELYEVDGTLCVRDLGSLNGTFVGDFRVTEAALESGDMLVIGGANFEVQVEQEPAGLLPPSKPAAGKKPADKTAAQAPEPAAAEEAEPEFAEIAEFDAPGDSAEEAASDIDFAETESAPAEQPAAAKAPDKPQAKAPAKQQAPATPKPQAPAPSKSKTPPDKSQAKNAPAAESGLDLTGIGEDTADPSTDDSGLNSFLRNL